MVQIIDPIGGHFVYLAVDKEDRINRQLFEWGVKSKADRTRILNSIRAAAQKACDRPRMPRRGSLILYKNRRSDPKLEYVNVIEFLRIVWGKWIEARVLTRRLLREHDPGAERALCQWLYKHNNKLPDDLQIPTVKDVNDQLILAGEDLSSPRMSYLLAARHARGVPVPSR